MVRLIADLAEDWRRLDERIAFVSAEIEALAEQDSPVAKSGLFYAERAKKDPDYWHKLYTSRVNW